MAEPGPEATAKLGWVADVPLLTNPTILRAGAFVFVAAFGLVMAIFAIVLAIEGDLRFLPRAMAALLLGFVVVAGLLVLVSLVAFQNRMRCRFALDENGFAVVVVDRRAALGQALALTAGAGSGDASLTGVGLMGAAARREYTRWERVGGVEFRPARRVIVARSAGRWPVGALHCSAESYPAVAARVREIATARGIAMVG